MHAMTPANDNLNVRVFFSLWPGVAERTSLADWQKPLRQLAGGRVMRSETLHATLVFIGEIAPDRLEALQLAAREVNAESFDLCFDVAHYRGHNHIVYAAPGRVPPQLAQLVEMLEGRLSRRHFEFERRAYKPHVTLLRNTHWTDQSLPQMQPVCWQVKDFSLVQSAQQDGASHYRVLARFPLRVSQA